MSTTIAYHHRQSAYRCFLSTETAVAVLHNDLVVAADIDYVFTLTLLDLGNIVDHQILLSVLLPRRFGVDTMALNRFDSYIRLAFRVPLDLA